MNVKSGIEQRNRKQFNALFLPQNGLRFSENSHGAQRGTKQMFSRQNIFNKRIWIPCVLLFAGLAITAVAAVYTKIGIEVVEKSDFDFACNEIQLKIDARMKAHAQILRSAAVVFNTLDKVSREDWKTFTLDQKIEMYLPGIQGIGFSLMIPRDQLTQHTQEIRNQGFPDYNLKIG